MEAAIKTKSLVFVSAVVIALFACSLKLKIGVLNNSDVAVIIVSGGKTDSVPIGGIAKFFYPTVAQQRRFQASFSGCTFTYEMPGTIESYSQLEGFNGEIIVQLEKDSRLYLIAPAATHAAILSDVATLQKDGFPVSPIEKRCQP